jgi:glycosyltransferase involved in cell wall biosynthesis
MKILIISASNPFKTAGIVVGDYFYALKKIPNTEVKLLVKSWGNYQDKDIVSVEGFIKHTISNFKRIIKKITRKVWRENESSLITNLDYSIQDYDQTITFFATRKLLDRTNFCPDVILVFFMQKFLSYKNLYELNQITKAPIYLYLMDMAPMTGGCHYAFECKGYIHKCGNCPALFSNDPIDQSRKNWNFKNDFVTKTNINLISGSEWTYLQLKNSSLFKNKPKYKVLLPINERIFCPDNKTDKRILLGLPLNKIIILIGALTLNIKRKGGKELLETLNILYRKLNLSEKNNIHIAIVGKSSKDFIEQIPFNLTTLNYLSIPKLSNAFQAADIFVSASIEDSGPMMINQSIMCGTPVVSFDVGVAIDLITNNKTGYRVELKNSEKLANAICVLIKKNTIQHKEIKKNCRRVGLNFCHPIKQTNILNAIFYENRNQ